MISILILAAAIVTTPPQAVLAGERPAYDAMLKTQALASDSQFAGSACPSATTSVVSSEAVAISDRPDFAARRERVKVTGCGRSSIQNINVGRFGGDPPWRMSVGLPGDSLADMQLQQSTAPAAIAQARTDIPVDCLDVTLRDIYVTARPGNVEFTATGTPESSVRAGRISLTLPPAIEARRAEFDLSKAWAEVWPIALCGKERTTVVVFIPLKGQAASAFLFLPVWPQIAAHGPEAAPSRAD